ncbi:polysaccharide biosynthesis C-terminal domain-containing protein [Chloroflexota bacterium]
MNTGQKIIRGIIYNATGNILVQSIGIITAVIIARTLGPEMQGTYVLILSIPITINIFITLGFNQGINRYIPALKGENREGLMKPLLRRIFLLRFALSILAILLIFLFSGLIENLFNIEGWLDQQILALIAIYLCVINLSSILGIILAVNYQQKWLNIANIISAVVMLLGILLLVFFDTMSVKSIMVVTIIPQIITLALYTVIFKMTGMPAGSYTPEELTEYVRKFTRYSSIMYLVQLAGFVLAYRSDIYFIAYYLGATSVSFYSIANGIAEQSTGIFGSRATGVMTVGAMTETYKKTGDKGLNTAFSYQLQFHLLHSIPIIFGGIYLTRDIIPVLYGDSFMPVVPLLMALFLVRFFTGFGGSYSGVMVAIEKPQYFLWTKIISIINIPLNILLIPQIGIMGAVIATAATQFITLSTEIFLTLRIVSIQFPLKNLARMILCGCIMLLAVFLFRRFVIIDNTVLKLVIEILVGAMAYGLAVINLDPLDKEIWNFIPEKLVLILNKMRFGNRIR